MKPVPHFSSHAAFGMRMQQLLNVLLEQMEGALDVSGLQIKPAETGVLNVLFHEGPSSLADVAAAMGYSHQLTTKRVNLLVKRDMARLEDDPDDKRRRRIVLTKTGLEEAERLQAFIPNLDAVFRQMFEEIGIDVFAGIMGSKEALRTRSLEDRVKDQF
ncbi:MAG: helix-turn-helix domain-containing protein [Maricaulis sp.]|jgi:DNA-binding MarR family transcriptional regulator|nr:helix-turn-helix domain-containing protein [Maricaulis sp.]MDG2043459.1 helix-turn-helix domain-containing protein [Maricaulis sp.]